MPQAPDLTPLGVWSRELRFADRGEIAEASAELEELGFGALWLPGSGAIFEDVERVLGATRRVVVLTGIVGIFDFEPPEVAQAHVRLDGAYPDRFVLGLGVGHSEFPHPTGRYARPLTEMRAFLDALDELGAHGPRLIAALGPKMIALSGERTLGTHPYMVPVGHTKAVRDSLGPERLVAPEVSVVVNEDPAEARAFARQDLEVYLGLSNYTNTWLRHGFTEADLADGASDRLVDALYAWGSHEQIGARVREHLDAGADHVCLRVVTNQPMSGAGEQLPRAEWRELAAALL